MLFFKDFEKLCVFCYSSSVALYLFVSKVKHSQESVPEISEALFLVVMLAANLAFLLLFEPPLFICAHS